MPFNPAQVRAIHASEQDKAKLGAVNIPKRIGSGAIRMPHLPKLPGMPTLPKAPGAKTGGKRKYYGETI